MLCVAWPLACVPLGAFGKSSFQLWAAVALMWGWCAGLLIILLPIYESWDGILRVIYCSPAGFEKGSSTVVVESKSESASVESAQA